MASAPHTPLRAESGFPFWRRAAGDSATPLRVLIFLAVSQHDDGGFARNLWVNGDAYWTGIQLDEVAFPVMLAWRLWREEGLANFDHFHLVRSATAFLIRNGPVSRQERWEEASGYSPSTLASNIAALVCAAQLFREQGHNADAEFIEEYADFLESHIEDWTVTNEGQLHATVTQYYMRILPENVGDDNPAQGKEERKLPDQDATLDEAARGRCSPGREATTNWPPGAALKSTSALWRNLLGNRPVTVTGLGRS